MSRVKHSAPAVLGVLAASVLLGLAYNSASPLGVRSKAASVHGTKNNPAPEVTGSTSASSTAPLAQPPAAPQYQNETVAMTLEPVAPAALPSTVPAPASAGAPVIPRPVVQSVTWAEVKPLLASGKVVMIDARAASAYQAEHIPGAFSLPAGSPPAEVSAFVAKHGKDAAYVIYCGSGQCGLSRMAADALIGQGCTNVKVMPGGFSEYRVSEAQSTTP